MEPEVAVQAVEPSVSVLQVVEHLVGVQVVVVILLLQLFDCHDLFSLLGDTVCVKVNEARRFFSSSFWKQLLGFRVLIRSCWYSVSGGEKSYLFGRESETANETASSK